MEQNASDNKLTFKDIAESWSACSESVKKARTFNLGVGAFCLYNTRLLLLLLLRACVRERSAGRWHHPPAGSFLCCELILLVYRGCLT